MQLDSRQSWQTTRVPLFSPDASKSLTRSQLLIRVGAKRWLSHREGAICQIKGARAWQAMCLRRA